MKLTHRVELPSKGDIVAIGFEKRFFQIPSRRRQPETLLPSYNATHNCHETQNAINYVAAELRCEKITPRNVYS